MLLTPHPRGTQLKGSHWTQCSGTFPGGDWYSHRTQSILQEYCVEHVRNAQGPGVTAWHSL
jgi:hypothetical protein